MIGNIDLFEIMGLEIIMAYQLLQVDSKSYLVIKNSKKPNAGQGMFTKKYIARGTYVTIYHGDKLPKKEVFDMYMKQPEEYYRLSPYMRGTPNDFVIMGDKTQTNPNLMGVYVNDYGCINCKKEELTIDILKVYAMTKSKCNVEVVDTNDYPVYRVVKRIKKGEELYAHYGIGYWLAHIGCSPEEIDSLNEEYGFENMY